MYSVRACVIPAIPQQRGHAQRHSPRVTQPRPPYPIYALAFALPAMEEGVPPQRELMLLVQANDCVQFNKKISLPAASLQVSVCEALAHA